MQNIYVLEQNTWFDKCTKKSYPKPASKNSKNCRKRERKMNCQTYNWTGVIPEPMKEPKFRFEIKPPIAIFVPFGSEEEEDDELRNWEMSWERAIYSRWTSELQILDYDAIFKLNSLQVSDTKKRITNGLSFFQIFGRNFSLSFLFLFMVVLSIASDLSIIVLELSYITN